VVSPIEIQRDADHSNNLVHWEPSQGKHSRSRRKLREARDNPQARQELERILSHLYSGAMLALRPFQPPGIVKAECPAPLSSRLVGFNDVALSEQVFDIAEAQGEAVVEPNGVAENLAGKRCPG
jgi:hypothetical protein